MSQDCPSCLTISVTSAPPPPASPLKRPAHPCPGFPWPSTAEEEQDSLAWRQTNDWVTSVLVPRVARCRPPMPEPPSEACRGRGAPAGQRANQSRAGRRPAAAATQAQAGRAAGSGIGRPSCQSGAEQAGARQVAEAPTSSPRR